MVFGKTLNCTNHKTFVFQIPCLENNHCSKEGSTDATISTQSSYTLNTESHPILVSVSLTQPIQALSLLAASLSVSRILAQSVLFSDSTSALLQPSCPHGQYWKSCFTVSQHTALILLNSSVSIPSGINLLSAFSQTLPTSQDRCTCLPSSQSDPPSPRLRITQLLVPVYSSVCLVLCLPHIHLRLFSFPGCQKE